MTNWYEPVLAVLGLGTMVFLLTLIIALLVTDVRRWWEDAGQMILSVTVLGACVAAPVGLACAESVEDREQRKLRATIGVKIGEHPDGSEVWKVIDGPKWAVYLKPKGKP